MKYLFSVLIGTLCLLLSYIQCDGQITVTGRSNTTPALSATYTTLAGAITALNTVTAITGHVTITLNAGYSEIAPAGGYAITFTAATTDSTDVTIDGSSSYDSIKANNSLTAGAVNDAIFKIIGSDHVTITRFTLIENSANTTTALTTNNMTEWGIALLRRTSSTTDGAQFNTIIDNNISLDRAYPNSFGIYSNVRHTPTTVGTTADITNFSGSNSGNKIYNNRISYVNMGIGIIGSSTDARMDDSNDVGGTSSGTGNTITNWGGTSLPTGTFAGNMSTEYYGILMKCQKNDNTSYNTVISSISLSGSTAAIVRGIHKGTTTGTVTGSFSTIIDHNTVTITDNLPTGSSSASRLDGIICTDKLADGILSISDNTVTGLSVTGSASGRSIRPISNSASAGEVHINRNTIKGNTTTATASGGWFIAIDQTGAVSNTIEIDENFIGEYSSTTPAISYSATANGATIVRGISNDPTSNPTGTAYVSISGNTLYGFFQANSPTNSHMYINCDHTTTINSDIHIESNHFENIDAHISGNVTFINSLGTMATSAGAQLSVLNNNIVGSFTKSLAGGDVYIYNANGSSSTGNIMTETGNNFSNISLTGSAIMHGWYNNEGVSAAGPEKHITENVFDTWTCSTSGSVASNVIYCNWASGNSEISGNQLSNITSNANLTGIADASGTPTTMTYDGNQISGLSCNSVLCGIDIRGGGNVARTLLNSSIIFLTNTTLNPNYLFAVQWSSTSGTGSNLDCYYNTIYLTIASTSPFFTSSCLAVRGFSINTTNISRVRNNIFINNSVPNTDPSAPTLIGKSSIIYNQGVIGQIANYWPTSNNNIFWLGTRLTSISLTSTAISDATHIIYQDGPSGMGGTDKVTLADFQGYVPGGTNPAPGGTESLSVSVMPEFKTIPPMVRDDLHLLSGCGTNGVNDTYIFNHGNNEGIGATKDWDLDGDARLTASPYVTDIGADQHIRTYTWTGAAGSAWGNNSNWTPSQYPDNAESNVYIPKATGSRPQPIIVTDESWRVCNVFFQTGLNSSLLPLLINRGTLKVAGGKPLQTLTLPLQVPAIRGDAGSFSNYSAAGVVVGSIEMNSSCPTPPQTLGGLVFKDKKVFDLRIRNNVDISTATNDGVKVVGQLDFSSGLTLYTGPSTTDNNQNLTMVSTADRTANVANLTGNTITGDVTVEKYIHTGTDAASGSIPAQHRRSWQLLSTPVSGQTVRQSWMERMSSGNDNISPGFGTNIPGGSSSGTVTGGYDQNYDPLSGPGIKWWDHAAIPAPIYKFLTSTSDQLNNPRGYFLFVRGDRSVINYSGTFYLPVPTTLRQKGPLFQPSNPPAQTTFSGGPIVAISVGNPYASAIDLNAMVTTGGFNNISRYVYVHDPLLGSVGGYQLLDRVTGYASVNNSNTAYYTQDVQYPYIQSGNAFYVSAATTAAGSITFTEAVKSTNQRLVNRTSSSGDSVQLNAALYLPGNVAADGNVVFFGSGYSNGVDSNDVVKLQNLGENFFILQDSGAYILAKRDVIGTSDSIFYSFNNLAPETYTLKFGPSNLAEGGLTATLIDNYQDTAYGVSLDADTEISFVVDSNAASMAGRFTLVFSRASFSKMAIASKQSSQNVFPNPVNSQEFFVETGNEFTGNCNIQVLNSTGQVILKQVVNHVEKKKTIRVNLGNKLPAGIYHVIISDEKGKQTTQHIIVK